MKLVIFIPALNEEKTIGKVIDSIPKNFSDIDVCEVVVVNDGSTDNTSQIALEKGAIVVKHSRNYGVGRAFHSGLYKALELKADMLVTLDADGQFDAEEIPKLIKPIVSGEADFVTGSRFVDKNYIPKNMPFVKRWGNRRVANIISWATGHRFYDVSCGFRAYSKEAMLRLNLFGKFTYTQETFLDLAFKGLVIKEVPVHVSYFDGRKSRVVKSIWGYAWNASNIIFRTVKDYKPLKFFGFVGIFLSLIGLGLGVFVFLHFLESGTFSPYKIVGFLGAFLGSVGIMIFFIGILADLIDRLRLTQEKLLYYQKKEKYE
jgi:glycosyltransferase involved in cell wall biosynthesis